MAKATFDDISPFMWNSGWATKWRSLCEPSRRDSAQSWPAWVSGTPFGRPDEPEV